jgi:hypothetical protein
MAKQPSMADLAEGAVSLAVDHRINLDYSEGSVKQLARLIVAVEKLCRCVLDRPDGARVADDVANLISPRSLGAYYGELFVRHAGAVWGEAEGEAGPEPAVIGGGGVTHLPLDTVRRRVFDGPGVDLVRIFKSEKAAMTKSRAKAKRGQPGPSRGKRGDSHE